MPCTLSLLIYQPLPQQLSTAHFSTMWLSKHYPQCTYINTLAKLKRLRESLSCDVDNNYNKFIACKAQFNIYYYYWTKISSILVTPSWSKCQKFDQINEIKNANSLILFTRKHNKTNPNYCLSLWCLQIAGITINFELETPSPSKIIVSEKYWQVLWLRAPDWW